MSILEIVRVERYVPRIVRRYRYPGRKPLDRQACARAFVAKAKALSWRISNTLDTSFCVAALAEAMERFGKPEIFDTDQGSQFTSESFTEKLLNNGIQVSMDGKGRWLIQCFL